jgi:hypothetical protein
VKLVLIGCEYTGTTTLARAINEWSREAMGRDFGIIHDHWKIPHTSGHEPTDTSHFLTDEEQQQVLSLSPKLKEMTQRHSLYYHTPSERNDVNVMLVGYVFDDSIYGPLYFEYGRPIDPEDRSVVIRHVERALLKNAPETVLVLVTAEPEVIRRRMGESPHPGGVLQEKDIEFVLERFQYEFRHTLFEKKLALDTSTATVGETLAEFVEKVEPHLTESDRSRMVLRRLRTR